MEIAETGVVRETKSILSSGTDVWTLKVSEELYTNSESSVPT